MTEAVLFVDDEPLVLEAHARSFRQRFPLWTAGSAAAGLTALAEHPEIGVVVSDMRMPITDGATFLAAVRAARPDSVRIMLTGQADVSAAIAAVNAGAVFRFLQKPCSAEELGQGIEAAFEQRRLIRAEKELLEQTLTGAVEVLAELLELANPALAGRSFRLLRSVQALSQAAGFGDPWELRVAALLSQIGCLAIPPETMASVTSGGAVTDDQRQAFRAHPVLAGKLIERIPRMETVAAIIARQLGPEGAAAVEQGDTPAERAAELLEVAVAFDELVTRGLTPAEAVARLGQNRQRFSAAVLRALPVLWSDKGETELRPVTAGDLVVDMVLEQDVRSKEGVLLVAKGKVVTETVILMLRNYGGGTGIAEPFMVRAPRRLRVDGDLSSLLARTGDSLRG